MVTRSSARRQTWRAELAQAVRTPAALCRRLGLDPAWAQAAISAARAFAVLVPPAFLAQIEPGNPHDPLLRQILPTAAETEPVAGYSADPLHEHHAQRAPGMLCKYPGRTLLLASAACAMHCRYCFRRVRRPPPLSLGQLQAALATQTASEEIVLSGGDPLMLDDGALASLFTACTAVPGLQRLRVHSRVPTVLPSRITPALCALFARQPLPVVVVLHVNHAAELGEHAEAALARLRAAGVILLNQSVLLRGVNDALATLKQLSERLCACGVVPYYLHRLDPVIGTAHFALPAAQAAALIAGLRRCLPGYLVPRLVREIAGAPYKLPCA